VDAFVDHPTPAFLHLAYSGPPTSHTYEYVLRVCVCLH